jgi:hypothetical protein
LFLVPIAIRISQKIIKTALKQTQIKRRKRIMTYATTSILSVAKAVFCVWVEVGQVDQSKRAEQKDYHPQQTALLVSTVQQDAYHDAVAH